MSDPKPLIVREWIWGHSETPEWHDALDEHNALVAELNSRPTMAQMLELHRQSTLQHVAEVEALKAKIAKLRNALNIVGFDDGEIDGIEATDD